MEIREARRADVGLLEAEGKAAVGRPFSLELDAQDRGEQSIFLALAAGSLLGSGFIRWLGPRDPAAFALLPEAPEIFRLEVLEGRRSQGIGTALLRSIEAAARERGFKAVSLGVAHANPRAEALYRNLGYADMGLDEYYDEYPYPLERGGYGTARDLCRYLRKPL
ncbi:MAG: GNAT family N-acetyltransferase [Pseudomonadota bacterium]